MKKWLQKRLKNEKGLTLVELLAVIVILGIIAAIAVPSIGNIVENSRVKAIKADALMVLSAAEMYYIDNPDATSPVTIKALKDAGFLDDYGSFAGVETSATGVTLVSTGTGNTLTADGKNGKATLKFDGATKEAINKATDVKSGNTITATGVTTSGA